MKTLAKNWGWLVAAVVAVVAILLSVMAKSEAEASGDGVAINEGIMEQAGMAVRDFGGGAQAGSARIFTWDLDTIREAMGGLGWSGEKMGSMVTGLSTGDCDITAMIAYWCILAATDSNMNNPDRIDDSDGVALVAYLSDNYGSE